LETTDVVVAKFPCPLKMTKAIIVEVLAQYVEMTYAELVYQKEWHVQGS
jgi:hypothetical protein